MMDFDKIKDAVNSIEMTNTMKNSIMENCKGIEKEVHLNFKKWISVACVFIVLLSITIGIPSIKNKAGLQVASFSITAYAADDHGNNLNRDLTTEITTFELSTRERIGLINSIGENSSNLIFTNVKLNITGENIDSIRYTINKGKFIEDLILTTEEKSNKDWLLSEKIYIIYSEPSSDIYQAIKEIGNTYTAMYNQQDKYEYSIAIPYDIDDLADDSIIINVNVKYIDGNTEQKDIFVIRENDSISLRLDS